MAEFVKGMFQEEEEMMVIAIMGKPIIQPIWAFANRIISLWWESIHIFYFFQILISTPIANVAYNKLISVNCF